ncbi:DIS3-like exonuclease 2 [Mercurialis annua]|uniref:DIS3-like exonuclease 2 n=1 Tax=Mercurialis annua TaxID=3986 RepID=UPI00215F1667|nr:DIS3-like exonuclease 2 [Mercurialis annua]
MMSEQTSTVVVDDVVIGSGGGGDKDKEKKKNKRRSNRRSKQNSPNLVNGGELSQSSGNGANKTKNYTSSIGYVSSGQPDFDAFSSLPTMHINGHVEQPLLPSEFIDGKAFSNSCHEPILGSQFIQLDGNTNFRAKCFAPHWSIDSVNDAIKKGDVFKTVFRVNAHNRTEAYCKIEGVSTDVLISGLAAQNRAVEGDIVVIKVDPLVAWNKMKGSNGLSDNRSLCNPAAESSEIASGSCKDKNKVEIGNEYSDSGSSSAQKAIHYEYSSCDIEAVHQDLFGQVGYNFVNGNHHPSTSGSPHFCPMEKNEAVDGLDRLCTIVNSHPSKRPTGRVVAILERSPRRNSIVGFLNIKQWFYYRECCKIDAKKNKKISLISDYEYIQLTPTDPKFPKMMVLISSLPNSIKKRLEKGDETVEMELVAAQIDIWDEDSPFPKAHISHILGRGSEMEPRISAILYENAICCSDFSPESLSCIPCDPWEVPPEEIKQRKDLRSLCIFTIDPSTATDLDDALSFERLPNGTLRVGVHIADVSYFVLPDTVLDKEAQFRSATVYMTRKKLPMLPPLLSENLGSLNPGVDRLAFSILWELNSSGDVIDRWMGRTVIHSCCKLSYQHAQDIVDGVTTEDALNTCGEGLPQLHGSFKWPDVLSSVKCLYEISKTIREKRFNDGALQLESSKISFLFDEDGIPYDTILCEQKKSNFLVEEFMLLANRTTAEVISRAFPDSALLRRHPEPIMRKLREFEAFCCKHGLDLDTSSSGNLHLSLESIRGKLKDDSVLSDILMSYASRPMQLATYFCSGVMKDKMSEWGHYALNVPLYTHFTSPLRRYPDIVVHRTLAAVIEAEELYMSSRIILPNMRAGEKVRRCFTGINFDKDAADSIEGREALSVAASKFKIPCTESLADVAAYCNERKLASRHVKDGCDKLYMWIVLKKKEVLLSDARVMALGPRFMSVYIQKLAIERRIYYEEVEGLVVEWLEATSTLVLNLCSYTRAVRRSGSGFYKELSAFALVVSPCSLNVESDVVRESAKESENVYPISDANIDPVVFPVTVGLLSTIPVALHAVGGDDGPIDIAVRLYVSSYFS